MPEWSSHTRTVPPPCATAIRRKQQRRGVTRLVPVARQVIGATCQIASLWTVHYHGGCMKIEFLSTLAVIAPDPPNSRQLYVDALGLPLAGREDDGYHHTDEVGGCKHFGVWPLSQAAEACFGTAQWPAQRPVPQVSIEFDVADAAAVAAGRRSYSRLATSYCMVRAKNRGVRPWRGSSRSRERSSGSRTCLPCTSPTRLR